MITTAYNMNGEHTRSCLWPVPTLVHIIKDTSNHYNDTYYNLNTLGVFIIHNSSLVTMLISSYINYNLARSEERRRQVLRKEEELFKPLMIEVLRSQIIFGNTT